MSFDRGGSGNWRERWSSEAMDFMTYLASARVRTENPPLRGPAFFAVSTLSVSLEGQDGHAPDLADLFAS